MIQNIHVQQHANKLMKCQIIAYDGCVYEQEATIKYPPKYNTTPNQY